MMRGAYRIVGAIVILVAAAYFLFGGREQPHIVAGDRPRGEVVVTGAANSPSTNVSLPAQPASAPTAALRVAPISAKLRADFASAQSWRAFALEALARPKEGGYFYAIYAADLCSRDVRALSKEGEKSISSTVSTTGTVSSGLQDVVKKVSTRCADFSQGEAAELSRTTRKRAEDGTDPLMMAVDRLNASLRLKDRNNLETALAGLLATRDPLVLDGSENLRRAMSAGSDLDKNGAVFYFEGVNYMTKREEEVGALIFAMRLATCTDNVPCALSDGMELDCITGGDCSMDRVAYVKKALAVAGPAQVSYQYVDDLRQKISAAIASNNVTAFLAPR
jgi:hypothetical protein